MKSLYVTMRSFCRLCILSLSIVAPLAGPALAQGLYNGSTLHVNGTNIYIDGEIQNDGKLVNDGLIAFTGDWASEGKYDGKGTLEVYGNTTQKLSHHGQGVERLVINGWGTKYIKGAIIVDGVLDLNHGVVEVSHDDALTLDENAVTSGGSTDSYVDGPLTVMGNGYRFFPIGKNGTYAPIEFLNVKGVGLEYEVEVFENAPVISVENVIVRNGVYWQRTDIVGTFTSSPVSINHDRNYFEDTEKIILLSGTTWEDPFTSINVAHSDETDKITTLTAVSQPIIILGEISERWTEADFYLSTALSPHAAHAENHKVKIFGHRLTGDQFRFQVFNRWGDLIYENASLEDMSSNGWDGRTRHGVELATGTYPYRLTALDQTGKRFEKKGVITIVN